MVCVICGDSEYLLRGGLGLFRRRCAAKRPLTNALVLAACFALSLDILEQFKLQGRSLAEVDWRRALGFGLFGLLYLGLFQYAYLVFGFKALFPRAEAFGSASLRDKVSDPRDMLDVLLQTGIDVLVLLLCFLPAYYTARTLSPATGLRLYEANWDHDARAVVSLWAPIDVLSFSAPLHWRLPLRRGPPIVAAAAVLRRGPAVVVAAALSNSSAARAAAVSSSSTPPAPPSGTSSRSSTRSASPSQTTAAPRPACTQPSGRASGWRRPRSTRRECVTTRTTTWTIPTAAGEGAHDGVRCLLRQDVTVAHRRLWGTRA
mmetsp:Transcript_27060/g.86867  ORF Transcript_27060/g.86867 Transcript_27060/m.86867 type:complete len:317 (-) Transcript_27060:21-971(-)